MPLVLRVISPSVRFANVIIAPIAISQKIPTKKPDFAKTYGSPRIPAPIIVPESVNVVAQNFLFMFHLSVPKEFVFIRFITIIFLKWLGLFL